jgi:hypothetical protein
MYLKGQSLRAIGKHLNLSHVQIKRDLDAIRDGWAHRVDLNIQELTNEELAKLDRVESQAWEQWDKSIGKKSKTTTKSGRTVKDNVVDEKSVLEWTDCGDPRYLAVIQKCIDKRCELLRLDPDKSLKVEHTGEITVTIEDKIKRAKELGLPIPEVLENRITKLLPSNGNGNGSNGKNGNSN